MARLFVVSFLLANLGFAYFLFPASGTVSPSLLPPQVAHQHVIDTAAVAANYRSFCGGCHGEKMDAFVDRSWKHGSSREDLFKGIKDGYHDEGMPAFDSAFNDEETYALADYIIEGIKNRKRYDFAKEPVRENLFVSEGITIKLDTVVRGLTIPWGMAFLPKGELLVTEKKGKLFRVTNRKEMEEVSGLPPITADGQGGLMDVILHPDYKENQLVYFSYSAPKKEGNTTLATTAIMRAKLEGTALVNQQVIFEALPYSKTRHHYGSRMVFGRDGFLYFSVGERGNEKENPQSTANDLGKIHRIRDDGSIPADNPFTNAQGTKSSIFSYGNRNPQGLTVHPVTGAIWSNEHGPRGGDEVNIIGRGKNYGWPAITYGINYNNQIISKNTSMAGMEQPLHYWIPSIGPSGMAFVQGDRYKAWKGDLLVGSLRFKYLNRCKIKNGKIVGEELLFKNIGRLRDVRMAPDGYIYIAVENPGYVFRLMPVKN
ncbi:MAG: PQQ-dependent sugar dehydrogenase [Ferruginibacter sp.]|nr:PQQ-dependent sugar dehydrogenase [Ferruginibacter sp.]